MHCSGRRLAGVGVVVALAALLVGCAEGGLSGNLSDLLGERATPAPVEGETKTPAKSTPPPDPIPEPVTPKLDKAATATEPEEDPASDSDIAVQTSPAPVFVIPPLPEPVGPALIRPPITGPQPLRVALLLPLSGTQKALGRALLDSAQLALFDVAPERLTLMPRDTGGTAEGAARSAEDVLGEGAEIILGPVFSRAVQAAAEPARKREVNVVAFSTDRSIAGNGVYLMGFMADQQVDRVMDYAGSQGLRRYASLAPMTRYGDHIIAQLAMAASRHGGEIVRIERYAPDDEEVMEPAKRLAEYEGRRAALAARRQELAQSEDPDAAAELERLENAETLGEVDFEAVMLPEGGTRLRAVAPLLPFYDVHPDKVRFLGTGLWDDDSIGREPALVGGWFAGPDPNLGKAFRARFEDVYGYRPPRIASLAYDAVALAAILSSGGQGANYTAEALTDPSGFAGADGLFRFRNDGIAERGLAVVEVMPRGLKVLDPAPNSFTAGGS